MVVSSRTNGEASSPIHGILLPDTHAHLDDPAFVPDLDAVIARARATGVYRILAVGSDLQSSERAVALAETYDLVYAAVGLHPHHAEAFEMQAENLHGLIRREKVVAVGEIGLDFFRGNASRDEQMRAFQAQLEWAERASLPVSVHNRDADGDIEQAMTMWPGRGVLHCFTSGPRLAAAAMEHDWYVSYAGNVTYPRSESIRDSIGMVRHERVLVETDAPVLSPQGHRGRRNEPCNVQVTAQVVADGMNLPLGQAAELFVGNADRVFGWGLS